jgi:hypothetical protein
LLGEFFGAAEQNGKKEQGPDDGEAARPEHGEKR